MINLASDIQRVATSARVACEKMLDSGKAARGIASSWQGEDQDAFQGHYNKLHNKVNNIHESYESLQSKLESLQRSIEAAEADKERKRREKSFSHR